MDVRQQLLNDVSTAELQRCIALLRRINQAAQAMTTSDEGQAPAALASPMPTAPKPRGKRSGG